MLPIFEYQSDSLKKSTAATVISASLRSCARYDPNACALLHLLAYIGSIPVRVRLGYMQWMHLIYSLVVLLA
jgi:hypothetical protein